MGNGRQGFLSSVRVIDASRVLAGPFCGQILGDMGADVIKIERPGVGDETRSWGPPFSGPDSAYFLSCNRNKRSLALDLQTEAGQKILHDLVRKSDVLLENFRTDSVAKMGLLPENLHAINPRLIICSISGFGRSGPWQSMAGYDFAIQGLSGLMSVTGPAEGPPCKVGVAVTDVLTGLYASNAILTALYAREKTGKGAVIDLALLDCAVAAQVNLVQAFLTTGNVPPRQGNAHLQIVPYQSFPTADDWIIVAIGNDGQWQRFAKMIGREDLASDKRFATNQERVRHRNELIPMLETTMREKPSKDWQALLEQNGLPNAPVLNYQQLFATEQMADRGMQVPVPSMEGICNHLVGSPFHFSHTEETPHRHPPRVGEHSKEILSELLGISEKQIHQLIEVGVVGSV